MVLMLPCAGTGQSESDPLFLDTFAAMQSKFETRSNRQIRHVLGDELDLLLLGGQLGPSAPTSGRSLALDFEAELVERMQAQCCSEEAACFSLSDAATRKTVAVGAAMSTARGYGVAEEYASLVRVAAAFALFVERLPHTCACGPTTIDDVLACTGSD